jgi:hypothetical protein
MIAYTLAASAFAILLGVAKWTAPLVARRTLASLDRDLVLVLRVRRGKT